MFDPSSLDESSPLPIAGVSSKFVDEDLSDVLAQLSPHVKKLGYPEGKTALLKLLAKHRHAVAPPGEPFGLTNRLTHHMSLQPDTKPSFVPSYTLPHSQRQVVQQKVDELLAKGVIQMSHSPWNSPLFLVRKMVHILLSLIFEKSVLLRCLTTTHSRCSVTCYNLSETRELFSAPLTLSQGSGRFPWMPNLGRSLPFPRLMSTMNGFASPWDCAMRRLPFRGWSIVSFQVSSGTVCFVTLMISPLSPNT